MRGIKSSVTPRPKRNSKKKPTGKRIGKSKPAKANNQLNRRIK